MTPKRESSSGGGLTLTLAISVAGTAALMWSMYAVHRFYQHPVSFDDSYISFHYARSLAEGRGLAFNLEDGPIEGFTNLGWVVLLAGACRVGLPLEATARVLGLACYIGTFAFGAAVLVRARPKVETLLVGSVFLGTLALPFGLAQVFGAGLETSLASLLVLASALLLIFESPPTRGQRVWAGALQFGLLLVRPDSVVLVGAFGAVIAARAIVRYRRLAPVLSEVIGFEGPAFVALLGLLAWKWWYFGSVLPNTYYAKSADVASWEPGWAYWRAFLQNSPQALVLSLLMIVASFRGFGCWTARCALVSVVAYVTYCARIGADFMYYRFAFQVYPLVVVAALIGLVRIAERLSWRLASMVLSTGFAGAALYLSTREPVLELKWGMQSIDTMNDCVRLGKRVGARLKEVLPGDTRIATTLAGTIPFETNLFTIDQWGLNDRGVGTRPSRGVRDRGHVKRAPDSYLRARGVQLAVDHPTMIRCTMPGDSGGPTAFLRMGSGNECLRLRYLLQSPEFTKWLCESPEFVVSHVECDPQPMPVLAAGTNEHPAQALSEDEFAELSSSALARFPMEKPAQGRLVGVAFGVRPARGALPNQSTVIGNVNGFLNGFHGGDVTTGAYVLELPPETTSVALRVGGGDDCESVFAAAVRGGVVVSRVCGTRDEVLRPVLLDAGSSGGSVQLVVVDRSSADWGHILVDEVAALGESVASATLRPDSSVGPSHEELGAPAGARTRMSAPGTTLRDVDAVGAGDRPYRGQ